MQIYADIIKSSGLDLYKHITANCDSTFLGFEHYADIGVWQRAATL
jgi:hypothetical protein